MLDLVRFGLTCERGKAALGEGNDSIGNLLPGYLAEAGAVDVQSFACDKTHALYPPYASEEQQALRGYYLGGIEKMLWPREKAKRYFLAGGGSAAEFEASWARREAECERDAQAIREERFHILGSWVVYLIAARRPADALMPSILLIRHAQASFGSADYDVLSDRGHEQAAALVRGLEQRGIVPAQVVSGTLRRQRDTAAPCAAAHGLEVHRRCTLERVRRSRHPHPPRQRACRTRTSSR